MDNGGNVEEEAKDDVDGNMNVAVAAMDEDCQRLKLSIYSLIIEYPRLSIDQRITSMCFRQCFWRISICLL